MIITVQYDHHYNMIITVRNLFAIIFIMIFVRAIISINNHTTQQSNPAALQLHHLSHEHLIKSRIESGYHRAQANFNSFI